jgi:hypothetical protein
MHICYYLTSHGFGHSVRACAICEHLGSDTRVSFRTTVPEAFFREELRRPFSWSAAAFDCGCLQSDSVTVDIPATLERYAALADQHERQLEAESAWLLEQRVDGVVCDIPAFPLRAAARAGLPSVAVANFTWYEVYREYAERFPVYRAIVESMREQYAAAGLLLEVTPALPMPYFPHRRSVGVIGRSAQSIRTELLAALGLEPGTKLALIYLGTFGMHMAWERLERFGTWAFLSADPIESSPRNLFVFDKRRFRFADVAVSVDLVISKLGYGIYSGCVTGGVPLLYLPRHDFAEYPALDTAIRAWGHGYCLGDEAFTGLRWEPVLSAVEHAPRPTALAASGAQQCAAEIERFIAERSGSHSAV